VLSAFGPNSEKAEALNTVSGGELRFTRSKYDRFLRKTSQTVWQKTGENREQISRTIYRYAGEAAKTAEKQTVYSFANKTVEETFYNSEGNKTLVRLSRTGEDEDGKATVTPVTETRYEYDGAGSMTAMTVKPLESPVDGQGVSEETTRYRESEFSKSKDTEIYRDEKLVKSVLYGAEETRTETRFITADYSVETVYKNNTLVSERYFFKGKEIRRRDYDETH
jgi:hypothetical protein